MAPSSRTLLVVAGAAGVGFLLWKYGGLLAPAAIAGGYVLNTFDRGARLNRTTYPNGVVPDDPEALRAAASQIFGSEIGRDTFALSRMGRSEGVDGMEFRMHVALNDLDDLQATYGTNVYSSVWALMLHSKVARADGHFSEQDLGKRYATDRDSYVGDVNLALQVQADHAAGIDPTGGALKFVDVDSFGVQKGTGSYEEKEAEWAADGLQPATLDGASSNFVVFRKVA